MLSVLSGYLGENEEPSLWLWNLVPTQAHMPGSDISKKTAEHPMIYWVCLSSLFGKIFAEHWSGNEIQTCNL